MKKQAKEDSYLHILKYTGLFGGVQGLNILVGIVRNKFVAMILGPDGMGLVSLFNSTIKLVSDSTNFGISMSAVKTLSEAFESDDDARKAAVVAMIRSWNLLTAILGMVLCVVLSPFLNKWTFSWETIHFILFFFGTSCWFDGHYRWRDCHPESCQKTQSVGCYLCVQYALRLVLHSTTILFLWTGRHSTLAVAIGLGPMPHYYRLFL
jgi:hypothetical protein